MDSARCDQLAALQTKLGYRFRDAALLNTALTHTSYVKGDGKEATHNERLEFLGDAVLELCVSEYLYNLAPPLNEGVMTRARALAVYEGALFDAARELELQTTLRLGHGEERSGGRDKPSILSDAMEAVIGAVYLDGGLEAARSLVMRFAKACIQTSMERQSTKDYKTQLQEYVQKQHKGMVEYVLLFQRGPDHERYFTMACRLGAQTLGTGEGRSKQEAGQRAAMAALAVLEEQT